MELITPDFGLMFWMVLAFAIVFFILLKFAFPVINKMLKNREEKIATALEEAEKIHEEMLNIQQSNAKLLKQAQEERDKMFAEARQEYDEMLKKAKTKANEEAERIIENAKVSIENERMAAMTDIKNQIANISIKVAEKILEQHLDNDEAQIAYINRLLEKEDKK